MLRSILLMILVCLVLPSAPSPGDDAPAQDNTAAMQLFHERIMPIFQSPQPSSCVQCHLAAVDLKNYIL
ncbi:MAG: hypothetical protein MI861_02485, partial [Pirellulales bacterium]|nr:hypothetical protein [Pirellulales bacterium]